MENQRELVELLDTVNGSGIKSGMPDSSRSLGNHTMDEECVFPKRMHRMSRSALAAYIDDQMSTEEFLRVFSLTDSRYIALGSCLVRLLE